MLRKQLFYLTSERLTAYQWQRGELTRVAEFEPGRPGTTAFAAYLEEQGATPAFPDFEAEATEHRPTAEDAIRIPLERTPPCPIALEFQSPRLPLPSSWQCSLAWLLLALRWVCPRSLWSGRRRCARKAARRLLASRCTAVT